MRRNYEIIILLYKKLNITPQIMNPFKNSDGTNKGISP